MQIPDRSPDKVDDMYRAHSVVQSRRKRAEKRKRKDGDGTAGPSSPLSSPLSSPTPPSKRMNRGNGMFLILILLEWNLMLWDDSKMTPRTSRMEENREG